jgi:hypothetical protein
MERECVRYGDFPTLFEGLPPEKEVDFDDARTRMCLIVNADWEAYRILVPDSREAAARKERARAEGWKLVARLGRNEADRPQEDRDR